MRFESIAIDISNFTVACLNDQPEVENFGKLEGKMKCEITNFAFPTKNSTYEIPFYRSVTPHRRKRCGAFEDEGLICTDGKGFGSCKGKTSSDFTIPHT